ncbi:uncharacterized protein LOC143426859 isoform X3 [Xylocopa sonorina]|uniref:uncharacterized protein LOC143426859 isoform X3 n=1 Tax=Xylocopa sonorina TaxID=1818115 RepID=UPI00403A9C4F
MENQGFEEEHQPRGDRDLCQDSRAFAFEQSGHELYPDDSLSILNADSHVYEDILPNVDNASHPTPSNLDARESNANSPRKPLDAVDYISRDSTRKSLEREDIAGALRRNLTLPFRRGVGLEPSNASSSVRLTNRKRNNRCREDAEAWNADVFIDGGFSSQAQSGQAECRPNRRRRKKDCKHCRMKAAAQACCSQEHQVGDRGNDTILRKNRNNEQQQRLHAMDLDSSDPQMILDTRNLAMVPLRSPIREADELAVTGNNSSPIFTISEKIDEPRSQDNTITPIEGERNDGRAYFANSTDANEGSNALTATEKTRASMRVNSIYSQDRWYTKEAPIFLADVKEHGSFQRAYSLPARTQTPSSQNRINLRRSVRGEPPPHPARLRKHRHGWTLHLAHPLEASGCTKSLALLLIAVLVLLGIGAVALYIALEPEKLHIIQQYLRSSANGSSLDENAFTAGTLLHQPDNELQNDSSTVPSSTTLAASMLLNSDRSFPESDAPLAPESETEATSLSSVNSTRYCDDCRPEEVCVALVDEQVPTCRLPLDTEDPTGCAGFCLINKQKCHRLDIDAFRCVTIEHYCLDDEWTCLNTLCIPLEKHCDGHMNCYDHSDEYNCVCDLETHFQCGNETSCLPLEKRCDGKIDCWDAADEINCTFLLMPACPSENEFTCSNGQCILKARFCDGLPDCLDGSDEPHGCQGRCNKHEFTCQNSRCITKGMKCNGVDDCGDGTDERHCKDRFS